MKNIKHRQSRKAPKIEYPICPIIHAIKNSEVHNWWEKWNFICVVYY